MYRLNFKYTVQPNEALNKFKTDRIGEISKTSFLYADNAYYLAVTPGVTQEIK